MFSALGMDISARVKANILQSELGENFKYYQQIKGVTQMMRTPQARMEYDVVVH